MAPMLAREPAVPMVALLLLVAGCGDHQADTPDGSITPDRAPSMADLGHPLPDRSLPPLDRAPPPADFTSPPRDRTIQIADGHGPVTNPYPNGGPPCPPASFPKDCSLVSLFQCGWGLICKADGKTIEAEWHHHNHGSKYREFISLHKCTYVCPKGCVASLKGVHAANGPDLVKKACRQ